MIGITKKGGAAPFFRYSMFGLVWPIIPINQPLVKHLGLFGLSRNQIFFAMILSFFGIYLG
jgi:hypothetical protein